MADDNKRMKNILDKKKFFKVTLKNLPNIKIFIVLSEQE